jgi:murein L,D-transpeptidase YcbB/YkuD
MSGNKSVARGKRRGPRRAARGGTPPLVPALVVAAAALLLLLLWWHGHLSRAEARVRDAITERLTRAPYDARDPVARALRRFYERRGRRPAWSDGRRLGDEAAAAVALLRDAAVEGLEPDDYADSALVRTAGRLGRRHVGTLPPDPARLAELDLALTRGFLRYARDVHDGRLPAGALDSTWVAGRDSLDLVRALRQALDGPLARGERPDYAPERTDYHRLHDALVRYRGFVAAGGWRPLPDGSTLRRGVRGARVAALRRRLAAEGAATGDSPEFDAGLARAVRDFQARHGLAESGAVDSATRAALNVSPADRAWQIAMNLERERWLPAAFREPHVLVNVPDFQLEVRDSGRVMLRSRVVVGEPRNPTPTFSAKLNTVVLNPTWRLPRRILVEETVPEFARDTSWFRRHRLRVYYTRAERPIEVPPRGVNWRTAEEDTFSYLVIQDPGPENPLGRVKLMCPNPYDVYLHDTPAKGYFSAAVRAYSHGCVRVQEARALAEWLLARDTLVAERAHLWHGKPRPRDVRDSLDAVLDSLKTRWVALHERVPVHFLYRTAWVDSAGAVQFRADLYGLDRRLDTALRSGHPRRFVLNPPVEWGEKHRATPLPEKPARAAKPPPPRLVPPEPRSRRAGTARRRPPRGLRDGRRRRTCRARLLVHALQELLVGLRVGELGDEELHRLDGVQLVQELAQDPDALQHLGRQQQLLLAGAGAVDVDGREDAPVGELAVEHQLGVPGALELLEDDLVHARAGLDQRGGDDGERAAALDVAGRAEEALGPLQGVGVHAAGEDLARVRHDRVVGAAEAGDRVEQDDHVAVVLDQALGLLDHHLRDLHVPLGRLVEGRGDDLALDGALHVGDLLGALVDEQHDEHDLGVVLGDGVRDLLQQDRLARLGRRGDQRALPLPHRREQVDDARLDAAVLGLEIELLLRVERGEVVEEDLLLRHLGALEVDRLHAQQGEVALALLGRTHLAGDGIAGVQIEALDLRGRDVDVVGTGQVVVGRRTQEAVALGQDLQHPLGEDQAVLLGLGLEDLEDELLLAQPAGALDLEFLGEAQQLGHGADLELLQLHALLGGGRGGRRDLFHGSPSVVGAAVPGGMLIGRRPMVSCPVVGGGPWARAASRSAGLGVVGSGGAPAGTVGPGKGRR